MLGEEFYINVVAAGSHLIHHVEGNDHGDSQFHQLEGKIQVPLNIGGIHNVDNSLGMLLQDKIPGDNLLRCIRRQRIDSRQIHHSCVFMSADNTILALYCYTREIAHVRLEPVSWLKGLFFRYFDFLPMQKPCLILLDLYVFCIVNAQGQLIATEH